MVLGGNKRHSCDAVLRARFLFLSLSTSVSLSLFQTMTGPLLQGVYARRFWRRLNPSRRSARPHFPLRRRHRVQDGLSRNCDEYLSV